MNSITTEEAETLAGSIRGASEMERAEAANALRTLAAERDLADEQIKGLSEERERWKDRAEKAEAQVTSLQDHIEGVAKDTQAAMIALTERAEKAEAEAEKLREALAVSRMLLDVGRPHAEINAEIDRILNQGGDDADQQSR